MNWNWLQLALLKKTIKKRMVCNVLAVFATIAIYIIQMQLGLALNQQIIKIQTNTNFDR